MAIYIEKDPQEDPAFKKWVVIYAKSEDKFFEDFAKAFQKLTELGFRQ